ncbi:hypothetical protein RchiOBHm_Chr3g0490881 [Rosa chinensis]|uniref:Uncharacterized protein n=1 Tax=Rosa chinensis TaxID=74649 RepID=A0A2P6RG59_ROSCH|nr:hypothetical protein RchiOBHm_Chr3g0490881 [Rosa chinensis]
MTFRMKLGSSISLWRRSLDSEFCINRSTHYLILHSPSRTYIGHNFERRHCRRCSNHCSKHDFEGRRCSLTTSFLGVNKHFCHHLVPSKGTRGLPSLLYSVAAV